MYYMKRFHASCLMLLMISYRPHLCHSRWYVYPLPTAGRTHMRSPQILHADVHSTVFRTAKISQQPRHLSKDEWTDELIHPENGISVIAKKKWPISHEKTLRNHEYTCMSQRSQSSSQVIWFWYSEVKMKFPQKFPTVVRLSLKLSDTTETL